MKPGCSRTEEIVASLRFGGASPSLRPHLAECRECSSAVATGDWMRQFSDAVRSDAPVLPHPRTLWAAAQLQRSRTQQSVRLRVTDLMQWGAYAIAAIGPAVWFAFRWPELLHWISTVSHGNAALVSSGSAPVLWTAVALGGIMTLVTLQLVFAEE